MSLNIPKTSISLTSQLVANQTWVNFAKILDGTMAAIQTRTTCPHFGHAKISVGLVGAQTKHTLSNNNCFLYFSNISVFI